MSTFLTKDLDSKSVIFSSQPKFSCHPYFDAFCPTGHVKGFTRFPRCDPGLPFARKYACETTQGYTAGHALLSQQEEDIQVTTSDITRRRRKSVTQLSRASLMRVAVGLLFSLITLGHDTSRQIQRLARPAPPFPAALRGHFVLMSSQADRPEWLLHKTT